MITIYFDFHRLLNKQKKNVANLRTQILWRKTNENVNQI